MPSFADVQSTREWLGSLRSDTAVAELPEGHGRVVPEAIVIREAHGDYVNRAEAHSWGLSDAVGPVDAVFPDDEANGRDADCYRDEFDLRAIWKAARYIGKKDPIGVGILRKLQNYILGTGFTYTFRPKEENRGPDGNPAKDPAGEGVAARAKAILNAWQRKHKWRQLEKRVVKISIRDGEHFLQLERQSGGLPIPREIPVQCVTEPLNPGDGLDWSFGIGTVPNDSRRINGYFVRWHGDDTDTEFLAACDVLHIKRNVDGSQKRGVSDFYCAELLTLASKLSTYAAQGAAIQSTIATVENYPSGTTSTQLQSMQRSESTGTQPIITGGGTTSTGYYRNVKGGRMLKATPGTNIQLGAMGTPAGVTFMEIVEKVRLAIGARWSFPQDMIASDASNANYSSSLVAGSKFVRAIEDEQWDYIEHFEAITLAVIKAAIAAGRFLRDFDIRTLEEFLAVVELDITPPSVALGEDKKAKAETDKILVDMGVKSPRTVAEESDLDFDNEVTNGAKKAEPPPSPFGGPAFPPKPGEPPRPQPGFPPKEVKESTPWWQCGKERL